MRLARGIFATFAWAFAFVSAGDAQETAIVAQPEEYKEWAHPLETSLDEVEALPKAPPTAGEAKDAKSYEALLVEQFIYVKEDGTLLRFSRRVMKIHEDEGIKACGKERVHFSAERERVSVARAVTITPAKKVIPVAEEGIFTEKAKASDEIHDDSEYLVLVFPEVTVGSMVERLTVKEVIDPEIPGQLNIAIPLKQVFPVRRQRTVMEVPQTFASKVRWHCIGTATPEPEMTKLANGRVRYEWVADQIQAKVHESGEPPLFQEGPVMMISTLSEWSELGNWFADYLEELDSPESAPMAAALEESAGDIHDDPLARIAELFRFVSQDIRYVALEFGRGGYCPRDAGTVIETRYGDCKDKANLLRELLKREGIHSRIALIDTRHAGGIDHEIPSPYYFNHAILAVDVPGSDQPVFCDPTLRGCPFGLLTPYCGDRDTLLVETDGSVEWKTTPEQPIDDSKFTSDLRLEPGGGYSGWITFSQSGFFGHVIKFRMERATYATRTQLVQRSVLRFLKDITIIDAELLPIPEGDQVSCLLRAYVIHAGAAVTGSSTRERINALIGATRSPATNTRIRRTALFSMIGTMHQKAILHLPEGWTVLDLPDPLRREVPGFKFSLEWQEADDALVVESHTDTSSSVFPPSGHSDLWKITREAKAWHEMPVLAKRPPLRAVASDDDDEYDDEEEDTATVWTPDADSLPRMPSVEGQLALIQARFPLSMSDVFSCDFPALRASSERLLEQFPDDPIARFEGGLRILMAGVIDSDYYEEGSVERGEKLIADAEGIISKEKLAGARLILASALIMQGKPDAAVAIGQSIFDDPDLPDLTRKSSAAILAAIVLYENPEKSLAMAREGMELTFIDPLALGALTVARLSSLAMFNHTEPDEIVKEWNEIADQHPAHLETFRLLFAASSSGLIDAGFPAAAEKLFAAAEVTAKEETWEEDLIETLTEARQEITLTRTMQPFYLRMVDYFKAKPWPDLEKTNDGITVKCASDCYEQGMVIGYDDPELQARLALRQLVGFGPQPDLDVNLEFAVETFLSWQERLDQDEEDLAPSAISELRIAESIKYFMEIWDELCETVEVDEPHAPVLMRGRLIEHSSGLDAAVEHYFKVAISDDYSMETRSYARDSLKQIRINQRRPDALLKILIGYDELDIEYRYEALSNAMVLALNLGRIDVAWDRMLHLAEINAEELKWDLSSEAHAEIRKRVALSDADVGALRQVWQQRESIASAWTRLAEIEKNEEPYLSELLQFRSLKRFAESVGSATKLKNRPYFVNLIDDGIRAAQWFECWAEATADALEKHGAAHFYGDQKANDLNALVEELRQAILK
ncbi:MAG: hypothetical protein ACI9R3_001647 [Verrucomicrobiales bacterium]|jgi:hypothetical protein